MKPHRVIKSAAGCAVPEQNDVADIVARIAWHRAEVARLVRQQHEEHDGQFLAAVFQIIGTAVFDAHDLLAAARLHPRLAGVLQDETPNSLGRRLMRLTNRSCGGFTVQFVERARRGRVYAIASRHLDAGP